MLTGREDGDITMSDGEKVDISKIRPGDRVTLVPLEVASTGQKGLSLSVRDADGLPARFLRVQIAAHHPAPREFQVGDRVRFVMGTGIGTVRGVDGSDVWVKPDDYMKDVVTPASYLTLVEGGE